MKPGKILSLLLVLCFASSVAWSQEAEPLSSRLLEPFSTTEEAEEALRTAKIVRAKDIGTGITNPIKLYLQQGELEFKAVFKSIDTRAFGITHLTKSSEVDFKDSWKFEIAAYELDKLLALNMVPPTVERVYKGERGSLQLWVENAMTEKERKQKMLNPPNPVQWNWQIFQLRLFDNLIYNIDRNMGNILVTPDWKMHLIDHSRSFKSLRVLQHPKKLQRFARPTMEALEKLNEAQLKTCCSRYLTGIEMRTLLERRNNIINLYQTLQAENSAAAIYFPWN